MKKLLSIIVVLLLALVLVGCGGLNNTYEDGTVFNVSQWDLYLQNEEILKRLDELENDYYTQEEVDFIVNSLLEELVEIKYTDGDELDVDFVDGIYRVTEYNNQGEIFDVDEYTIQDVIDEILAQK